jgi:hypothetical protein
VLSVFRGKGLVLSFLNIATNIKVDFLAFLNNYDDTFSSNWNHNSPFGRMDPISTYKNTARKINLGWNIVSEGLEDAIINLYRCQSLISMLYPVFDKNQLQGGISFSHMISSPLFRVKFANLIQDAKTGEGLICSIDKITYDPQEDSGYYFSDGKIFPQTVKMSCNLVVYHNHELGWQETEVIKTLDGGEDFDRENVENKKREPKFPYSAGELLSTAVLGLASQNEEASSLGEKKINEERIKQREEQIIGGKK